MRTTFMEPALPQTGETDSSRHLSDRRNDLRTWQCADRRSRKFRAVLSLLLYALAYHRRNQKLTVRRPFTERPGPLTLLP